MKLDYVDQRLLGELGLVPMRNEKCKIETQRLQIRVDGGRRSHRVQIKFHVTVALGLELALAFWL